MNCGDEEKALRYLLRTENQNLKSKVIYAYLVHLVEIMLKIVRSISEAEYEPEIETPP